MRIFVVLGHPKRGSFNHAIAEAAVSALRSCGHEVVFHDLYEENFDPMLPGSEIPENTSLDSTIKRHCEELAEADGIIVIHPNWWGQPPAILKGWVDRVFRAGTAYKFLEGDGGEGVPVGLLKAKAAIVFNTSNTTSEREFKTFGDPLETLWKNCIFGLCGVNNFHRRTFSIIIISSRGDREKWLVEVKDTVARVFPA